MNETHVSAQTDGQCVYFCLIFFFFFSMARCRPPSQGSSLTGSHFFNEYQLKCVVCSWQVDPRAEWARDVSACQGVVAIHDCKRAPTNGTSIGLYKSPHLWKSMGLSSLKTCYSAKMLILPSFFSQKDMVFIRSLERKRQKQQRARAW